MHFFGQFAMQNDCIKFNLLFRYDAWLCHVFLLIFFCTLTKHLFHRDERPFTWSSEFVCVFSLPSRACSVLHSVQCTWTENWFELVKFNWLTIIYASCKHIIAPSRWRSVAVSLWLAAYAEWLIFPESMWFTNGIAL